MNRVRTYPRRRHRRPTVGRDPADGFLGRLPDTKDDLAREWDRDHARRVVLKLLAVVRADLAPTTWKAIQRFGVDGLPAGPVAQEFGRAPAERRPTAWVEPVAVRATDFVFRCREVT